MRIREIEILTPNVHGRLVSQHLAIGDEWPGVEEESQIICPSPRGTRAAEFGGGRKRQEAARLDVQSMVGTPYPNPQHHPDSEPVRGPRYNPLFKS